MRQRPHALLGREPRERRRRLAAAPEDHERHQARQRDEYTGSFPVGRADEPDGLGRQARLGERRPQHLVDEGCDGPKRCAAGSQDGAVQALQELTSDVDSDVRPRFEVRADDADRDPPFRDLEPVRQPPRVELALERRQRHELLELRRDRGQTSLVEAKPVESTLVKLCSGGDVGLVRREHALGLGRNSRGGERQRRRDRVVGEPRHRLVRCGRLAGDGLGECQPARCRASSITVSASARLP